MSETTRPLILSIETATRAGSVAVTRGETLLALRSADGTISHSSYLLQSVRNALEEAGVGLSDVDLFAAASGPGSFTGLRIGLATVKAFAAILMRPCVGVPTLHAVAHAAGESERTLALLPGGRGEVFAQLSAVSSSGEVHPLEAPVHLTPQKLLEKVRAIPRLTWAGDGVQIHSEFIKAQASSQGILLWDETQDGDRGPSDEQGWTLASPHEALATDVAEVALLRFRSDDTVTPELLQAIYVRPSDAELNEQCRE